MRDTNEKIAMKNYMIIGTKVKLMERKAHIYSGTSNAIDSYEIPKSKKNTFNFVRTHASFQINVIP